MTGSIMKETFNVDGIERAFHVRHNVMTALDLAVNAVSHYTVRAVNEDGSRFEPLSFDDDNPRNIYMYLAIVKKNIDEMINEKDVYRVLEKGVRVQEVEFNPHMEGEDFRDYFIPHEHDVLLRPDIDMESVNYSKDDEFKGLLKLVLDKSYDELKERERIDQTR